MYENCFQTVLELEDPIVPFVKIWFLDTTHENLVARFVVLPKAVGCRADHRASWGKGKVWSDRVDHRFAPIIETREAPTASAATLLVDSICEFLYSKT